MTREYRRPVVAGERTAEGSRLVYVLEVSGGVDRRAECRCDCGRTATVALASLRSGSTLSCGCLQREVAAQRNATHRMSKTTLYNAWSAMKTRCGPGYQSQRPTYSGVSFCDEWATFEGFLANQPRGRSFRPGLVLARFNDVGSYSPSNCYWATKDENARDLIEHTAHRMSDGRIAVDVARSNGIGRSTFQQRVGTYGWSVDDAATTPIDPKFRRKSA